jgi:hypothetical protein
MDVRTSGHLDNQRRKGAGKWFDPNSQIARIGEYLTQEAIFTIERRLSQLDCVSQFYYSRIDI